MPPNILINRPALPPYEGWAAFVPLDYGHTSKPPEHSVLLIPEKWESLRDLLYRPADFIQGARDAYAPDVDIKFDFFGPLTIILEPLTVLKKENVQAVQLLGKAFGDATVNSTELDSLVRNWKTHTPQSWRNALFRLFRTSFVPNPDHGINQATVSLRAGGVYLVEFAVNTRVMVIRYLPPEPGKVRAFYQDSITSVTFSDILHHWQTPTRGMFMHFDLLPKGGESGYNHDSVARLKAEFTMDYLVSPVWVLGHVCNPSIKRLDKGQASYDYHYAKPDYVRTISGSAPALTVTQPEDAEGTNTTFAGLEDRSVIFPDYSIDQFASREDPTVILESVDPWADGLIWTKVPQDPPDAQKYKVELLGENTPTPCVLIWVVVNGVGQWVIDPASALLKNYVSPE